MATTDQMLVAAYGSKKIATGEQTVSKPSYAFEAWEDTTFGKFYDEKGDEIANHDWKNESLSAGRTAYFGAGLGSFEIASGGLGQIFKSI